MSLYIATAIVEAHMPLDVPRNGLATPWHKWQAGETRIIDESIVALYQTHTDAFTIRTVVEDDGTFLMQGDATVFKDFSVPLTRDKRGSNDKPDYDETNLGLLFPQDDTGEIVYFVAQMQHDKKMDSSIYLHIHYRQTSSTQPTFKIDYKFYNNGSEIPADFTTISTADGSKGVFDFDTNPILQIATFPAVSPPDSETVSANMDIKLYRDDNDLSGDCLTKYIDFHYEVDTMGSRDQFSK